MAAPNPSLRERAEVVCAFCQQKQKDWTLRVFLLGSSVSLSALMMFGLWIDVDKLAPSRETVKI
jgi:hypothetical protein